MGQFFRGLTDALRPSLQHDKFENNHGGQDKFFDQKAYMDCLPSYEQNKDDDIMLPYFEWYLDWLVGELQSVQGLHTSDRSPSYHESLGATYHL
jgi:hypothetical protein